jgi:plasmid stabilization system protein ParE
MLASDPDFPYEMPDPNAPPPTPREREPTAAEVYDRKMREVVAAKRAKPKGRAHTPSLEETYRALIRAGQVRIIRKKGRAPVIQWL